MSVVSPFLQSGSIITSRVRLARNLSGYPFNVLDVNSAKEVVKKVNRALVKVDTFNLYQIGNLTNVKLDSLKERYLISSNLAENKSTGAVLINQDESLSIMVHEEDIIREQCFMRGLRLTEAYKRLSNVDDELSKNLDFAYSDRFGFITACPTNLGTGLRASVMMFLPALTESGKINDLIEEVSELGLTVRGVYGEGSKAEGYTYQISNEVTLGVSEYDIISQVEKTVEQIVKAEHDLMQSNYLGKNELYTMDRAKKAFGLLTNAVVLTYSEFLEHISNIKLGAMLGVINISDIEKIDDLIVMVRPASICDHYGKKLNSLDRDLYRAELVKNQLLKLKE